MVELTPSQPDLIHRFAHISKQLKTKSEKSGLAILYDLGTDCGNYDLFLVGTCSGIGAEKFTC